MSSEQQEAVRKHMYLITEHENEARVGGVSFMDSRMHRPLKNEEGAITVLDDEKEGFRDVGKKVGLGYHDFESQEHYEDNEHCAAVIKMKLGEVDEKWLRKAGIEPEEFFGEEVSG